jgi:hypothetical protein
VAYPDSYPPEVYQLLDVIDRCQTLDYRGLLDVWLPFAEEERLIYYKPEVWPEGSVLLELSPRGEGALRWWREHGGATAADPAHAPPSETAAPPAPPAPATPAPPAEPRHRGKARPMTAAAQETAEAGERPAPLPGQRYPTDSPGRTHQNGQPAQVGSTAVYYCDRWNPLKNWPFSATMRTLADVISSSDV